ncbi:hypothetical protein G7Y89_g3911 [Cudoniella acicularis]|uniref:Major facilitator superfamily (MFS) profile domain-containing protein n=1 Tax=Cudoniella acicularis TaxID=354080 RepID=A0A8H4RTG5_9HELO|nr:hypothetical protein G7Y89_g3911 [Cudoniella acicularis]
MSIIIAQEKQPFAPLMESQPLAEISQPSIYQPPISSNKAEGRPTLEQNAQEKTPPKGSNSDSRSSDEDNSDERTFQRGPRFWAIMLALAVTNILGSLEGTVVSTALPTIIHDLGGGDLYLWAANGYFLSNQDVFSMAFQPLYAQAADIFGRRWVYIFAVLVFAVGSAMSGVAHSMGVFIFGRVIQGVGGGGLVTLGNLIICDLVPLRERGAYLALIFVAITIGNGIGPFVGGVIVTSTTWRWVFFLNLPLAGLSLVLLVTFLQVGYRKEESVLAKLKRIDYIGEAIFLGSVVAIEIALTYGGVTHPWSAWQTILPLILGFVGLAAFLFYEGSRFCLEPTIPLRLFRNRTTIAACALGFIHSLLTVWAIYFLPVYFQAGLGSTPARSGVELLPTVLFLIPFAAISGKVLQQFGRYRPLSLIGFAFMVIGFGLFTLLSQHSSMAEWVIFQAITAGGAGFALSSLLPAAQASLEEADTARITGTFSFIRSFGISVAVSIPGAIFNSRFDSLAYRISDASVRAELVGGNAYEYATKSFTTSFQNPLHDQIVGVYIDSLRFLWEIALGIAGLGLLVAFLEKEIVLRKTLETDYGMTKKKLKDEKEGQPKS